MAHRKANRLSRAIPYDKRSASAYEFTVESSWVMESPRQDISFNDIAPGCQLHGGLYFVRGLELGALTVSRFGATSAGGTVGVGSLGASAASRAGAARLVQFGSPRCQADQSQCVVVRAWLVPLGGGVGCAPGYAHSRGEGCVPDTAPARFDVRVAVSGPPCDEFSACDYDDELRFLRKAAGLRAADLAEALGVSSESVSHWETGKHAPDVATRNVLAALVLDALGGKTTTKDRLKAFRSPPRARRVKVGARKAA